MSGPAVGSPGWSTDDPGEPPRADDDILPEIVYHDAALAFLETQMSASDVLDGRAAQALTVGSAALPLTIALVNVARPAGSGDLSLSLTTVPTALFVVALLCYLAILGSYLRLGRISRLEYRPDMQSLRRNFLAQRTQDLGGRGLKSWVADAYVDSIEVNAIVLDRKSRWVFYAQLALALEGASLAIGAAWALVV
jgi:hypothetical protein